MAESHQPISSHAAARTDALRDYESIRQDALRQYNSLLLDARGRLQAALKRVEQERVGAEPESVRELRWKIHELIEYLSKAKL